MVNSISRSLASILLTFFVLFILALESRASEIAIDSDILHVNQASNHAIFKGNVVVNFRDMVLKADLIEVFYVKDDQKGQKQKSKIDKIVIPGKLKAVKPCANEVVIADRALYEIEKSKLTLTGNVLLSKDSNIIKTSEAVYYTDLISKSPTEQKEKQNKQ